MMLISETGEEVDMYQSMRRLCSILDGAQYREFVKWTQSLNVVEPQRSAHNPLLPFTPRKKPNIKRSDEEAAYIKELWGTSIP